MDEKSYHSRLLDISNKMDKVIEKLKGSYIDEKLTPSWVVWLLMSPIRDISKVIKLQHGLLSFFTTKMFLAILPFITAAVGAFLPLPQDPPKWLGAFVSFILGYLITMGLYFPKLTQFNNDHFHIGAYKTFRKQEYLLFKGAFLDPKGEFYFKGVYDYVSHSKEGYRLIQSLIQDFLQNERTRYESQIHSRDEKINELQSNADKINSEFSQFLDEIFKERDEILEETKYVVELLKDLNTLLFRVHNKGLYMQDLDILTGFTLYELRGETLVQVKDVRTSGVTAKIIDLDEPRYQHYGAVKVIKENLHQPYFNEPYEGHMIVSYKIRLDHDAIWVYNFHFDNTNLKARKLLIQNGIIESKEIYRLIHALCLLSRDFENKSKEGAVNQ